MGERVSKIWGSVKDFWGKMGKKMRILLLGGLAGVLLLSLVIVMLLGHTDYIVLYNNLTMEENASVLAMLQEMGVEARLEGSTILIPEGQESTVRMQLAMRDAPSSGGRYDTYALGSGLTATQSDKNFYTNAQREEDLEKSIKSFPEVRDARVTISVPENDIFVLRDEIQKPSAAVKIEKMSGRSLTTDQVRGILNLVRDSVPGLEEENISIVDETGDMRTMLILGSGGNTSKLKLSETVNATIEKRIMDLLVPRFGSDKVVVKANSVLDTDEKKTIETIYKPHDPENPQNNPLDFSEREYERTGGPGVVEGVPGANDNTDVPQYAAEEEDDGTGDYYRNHVIYDYLVSSEVNEIVRAGLTITDMTVAVLIDQENLSSTERDQIYDLVAMASGIEQDKISVQNMVFVRPEVTDNSPVVGGLPLHILILIIVGILALVTVVVIAIMMSSKKKKEQLALEQGYGGEASLADLLAEREEEFEPIQLAETQEQKLKSQIKDLANSDPEIVAQLIKTWLISA